MSGNKDKSKLFLIEFIVALIIFCVTAAVCAGILASAYNRSRESKALDKATLTVSSAIDLFKATGDAKGTAKELGGSLQGNSVTVYYDASFTPCESEDNAFYTLNADFALERLSTVSVNITDSNGETLFSASSSVITQKEGA